MDEFWSPDLKKASKKFMKITRRGFELLVEKSEISRVHRPATVFALCAKCGREVRMLSPEAAANLAGVSTRKIYQLIETNRIHFTEPDGGPLLVCLDSLSLDGVLR